MPTTRPNSSPAKDRAPEKSASHGPDYHPPSTLIHFEGDWPYRERLWLRQRVREADRTLRHVLGYPANGQAFLYGARWLAERSTPDGQDVRLTVHRQGTNRVLVGTSLGQIERQIDRLPLLEQRPDSTQH